ncbi:MAG: hypothetical protein ACQERC_07385 [Bacteroidota bacterium]
MNEHIEQLFKTRSFNALTSSEREEISEWATTEEEFEQMKQLFIAAEYVAEKKMKKPRSSVKRRLDRRFQQRQQYHKVNSWRRLLMTLWPLEQPLFLRPALQIGVVVLVVALILPIFDREPVNLAEQAYDPGTSEAIDQLRDQESSSTEAHQESESDSRVRNEELEGEEKSIASGDEIERPREETGDKKGESTHKKAPATDAVQSPEPTLYETENRDRTDDIRAEEKEEKIAPELESRPESGAFMPAEETLSDEDRSNRTARSDKTNTIATNERKKVDPAETVDLLVTLY